MAFGKFVLLPVIGATLFGWLSYALKTAHNFAGPVFAVSLVIVILPFVRDNLPRKGDLRWLVRFGGLTSEHGIPSHRFNAGEKVIFWLGVFAAGLVVVVSRVVPGAVAVISPHILAWTLASIHLTILTSRGLRVMVMRLSGAVNFCAVMALGRANSRSPSAPWIRPKPESPDPPNGRAGMPAKARNALTDTMPTSSFSARARPRLRLPVKMAPPRP